MSPDLDDLLARMASAEPNIQMPALEEAAGVVRRIISAAISVFETTPLVFPAAGRLLKFGASIRTPLELEFTKQMDRDRKTHAAMVLLYLGSRSGVDYLLEELAARGQLALGISAALSTAGIVEAGPLIEAWLHEYDVIGDPHGAAGLITSLKKLRWTFSAQLMDYLSRPGLSKSIELALAWEFPGGLDG
jgi:hypothetical protein